MNFIESVRRYHDAGSPNVNEDVRLARLNICKDCEYNRNLIRCAHPDCGCFLPEKTRWATEHCPIHKWEEIVPLNIKKGSDPEPKGCCG